MDNPVEAFATVESAGAFWLTLGALLTDEVVIAEAIASGMDWPDFEEGRRRLSATRRAIVETAASNGWIGRHDVELLVHDDPQLAMAAARPWIEREQQRDLGSTMEPDGR